MEDYESPLQSLMSGSRFQPDHWFDAYVGSTVTTGSGVLVGAVVGLVSGKGVPQLLQNCPETNLPQFGHAQTSSGLAAPQLLQKFTVAALPQFGQFQLSVGFAAPQLLQKYSDAVAPQDGQVHSSAYAVHVQASIRVTIRSGITFFHECINRHIPHFLTS